MENNKKTNKDFSNDTFVDIKDNDFYHLYNLLAYIKSPEEVKLLLDDLCTYKELEYLHQRVNSAIMLLNGSTYQQVSENVDNISTATLSRVSRCIKHGSGGYSKVLKDYLVNDKKENNDEN